MEALRDLSRTVPDPSAAASALEALYEMDPASAAEIAEKRLVESLANDCAPPSLVKLLHEKGQAPFRLLADRLAALGCERRKMRPERALFPKGDEAGEPLRSEARTYAERIGGTCQKAFVSLMGLEPVQDEGGDLD